MFTIKKLTSPTDMRLINQCIEHLRNGNILIYPTDTAYGLGVNFGNQHALDEISKLKNRPNEKKYSVIAPSMEWILDVLDVNKELENILRQYLPGEFTFVLKFKDSDTTLGVRIPKSPFIQMLAGKYGQPITATSANISSHDTPYSVYDLNKDILKNAFSTDLPLLVIDAGQLPQGKQSTIVDLTKKPAVILRQGSGKFKLD